MYSRSIQSGRGRIQVHDFTITFIMLFLFYLVKTSFHTLLKNEIGLSRSAGFEFGFLPGLGKQPRSGPKNEKNIFKRFQQPIKITIVPFYRTKISWAVLVYFLF